MWSWALVLTLATLTLSGCVGAPTTPGPTTPVTTPPGTASTPPTPATQPNGTSAPLRILLTDVGFPEVKYLEPTLRSIELERQEGGWVTIWTNASGQAIRLTPDGAEIALATVDLPAGKYVGTRLVATSIGVLVDANRDGDTVDANVEIVLTEAEYAELPARDRPSEPEKPPTPPPPSGPTPPSNGTNGGQEPTPPTQPTEPSGPPGVRHEGGLVYMGQYINESHTATPPFWDGVREGDYLVPLWANELAYDGRGGTLVYDFTLDPFQPKDRQIVVEASYVR